MANEVPPRTPAWGYWSAVGLAVACWVGLVVIAALALLARSTGSDEADQEALKEWFAEVSYGKALPGLAAEYIRIGQGVGKLDDPELVRKGEEIREQLQAMAYPLRVYSNQLPLFPEISRIRIESQTQSGTILPELTYRSPVAPTRGTGSRSRGELRYPLIKDGNGTVTLYCEYRLHAYNAWQLRERNRDITGIVVISLIVIASFIAALMLYLLLRRERARELGIAKAAATIEHQKAMVLEQQMKREKAEREKEAAELKSIALQNEIWASIGAMAGSVAHNIKNVLVKPNDLLVQLSQSGGLTADQSGKITAVRETLGTVSERLQQILHTVRRDPNRPSDRGKIDLAKLAGETAAAWGLMARERWRMNLTMVVPDGAMWVEGDRSHLQQMLENLMFNARDATFVQRRHVIEAAQSQTHLPRERQAEARKQAHSWRGEVAVRVRREGDAVVLEVIDNGNGMTPEVRERCCERGTTTKVGESALEGLNAGSGLGLWFVSIVLQNHAGRLEIESQPGLGSTFRVRLPAAEPALN